MFSTSRANKSTSLSDGDICIDTSKYADSSNSSYKIYIYDSRRDPTYIESDIEEIKHTNDPSPETVDKFWVNVSDVTIKPVDTNGAGDVFHAAFAVRYLETQNLMECMRFASAVSAFKCLKLGGRAGIPNRKDVDEFLKNN